MSEPAPTSERARAKIAAWKASLLDLSARNPLVSLPEQGLVDLPSPNDVYEPLLRRRKPLTFWDLANRALDRTVLREPANYPARSAAWGTFRHLRLQALSLLQGQDVNALYVVFGVLSWVDPVTRGTMRSPLLLVPVTLERSADGASYVITRSQEEDVELNPVLAHRLELPDIGLTLPTVPEEAYLIPSAYLRAVSNLVEERDGWEVEERSCLGLFPLLKMRLYEDLVAQERRAEENPLVAALAGEGDSVQRLPAVDVPGIAEIAHVGADAEQFLLLDADPAQQRATLAAARGQSFVLQGPPGTGKTQTITNIISQCVAANKSVLLVSGRMASLDAVLRRLSDKGLGDLCLAAHSLKTSKRDILAQLEQSLSSPATGGRGGKAAQKDLETLDALRQDLDTFARALHEPRLPLGLTAYEANGIVADAEEAVARTQGAGAADAASLLAFSCDDPLGVTPERYAAMEEAVRDAAADPALGDAAESSALWHAAFADPDRASLRAEVEAALDAVSGPVQRLEGEGSTLAGRLLGAAAAPTTVRAAARLLALADAVSAAPRLDPEWLNTDPPALRQSAAEAARLEERCAAHLAQRDAFLADRAPSALDLDHDDLHGRLTVRAERGLYPLLGAAWPTEALAKAEPLKTVLAAMAQDARSLYEAMDHLSQRCGIPLDESFEGKQRLLRIALRASEVVSPATGWFAPGAPQNLVQLLDTVRGQWFKYSKLKEDLFAVYSDRILEQDHAGLIEALQSQPSGLGRLVNTGSIRAAGVLKSLALPGANLKERDSIRDLQNAALMKEILRWIQSNEAAFSSSFGSHYRGAVTDWDRLREALLKADALCSEFPAEGGRIPPSLAALMAVGGEEMESFRERQSAISGLFADLRMHWDELSRQVLPSSLPEPQSSLLSIAAWCDGMVKALEDYGDAFQVTSAVLRPSVEAPAAAVDLLGDLEAGKRLRTEEVGLRGAVAAFRTACGPRHFRELDTDWKAVGEGLAAAAAIREAAMEMDIAALSSDLTARLGENGADGSDDFRAAVRAAGDALRAEHRAAAAALGALDGLFAADYLRIGGLPLDQTPLAALTAWLQERRENTGLIHKAVRGQGARDRCAALGLTSFFDTLTAAVAAGRAEARSVETVVLLFRARFHRLWLDAVAEQQAPALRGFVGDAHDREVEQFRDLDRKYLEAAPGRIREMARARSSKLYPDEVKALKEQLARRRTGEVRKLLARIPNLLFALKPCVMMNPLSVRLFLDADAIRFDVVLFDDASQIATEDAVGAILRGQQVIIAGDPKQLPPLSLIQATAAADSLLLPGETAADFESVLDAANRVADTGADRFARYSLNWHYRSQNEALIAFSRRYFYPSLMSFPSALVSAGVVRYVPVTDGKDEAESGTSHSTERVVDMALDYKRRHPERSVGVITLTEVDYARLLDAFARRREEDPEGTAPLLGGETDAEGFFVKMIENVQGDERDMIVLHVGSDPSLFTPLLEPGSDRLLNVATTRARCDMLVVSALPPGAAAAASGDMANAPGLQMLRAFLEYAADPSVLLEAPGGEGEDPVGAGRDRFRTTLRAALASKGYELRERIGLSDYRVDLGIVDPAYPERYLLGIECDGPMYAASGTARHRDRLCPDMLAQRGWRLCRVWSPEWNRDPARQIKRITAALAAAKKAAGASAEKAAPA